MWSRERQSRPRQFKNAQLRFPIATLKLIGRRKRNKVDDSEMVMAAGTSKPPTDTRDFHFDLLITLDDRTTEEGAAEPHQPDEYPGLELSWSQRQQPYDNYTSSLANLSVSPKFSVFARNKCTVDNVNSLLSSTHPTFVCGSDAEDAQGVLAVFCWVPFTVNVVTNYTKQAWSLIIIYLYNYR